MHAISASPALIDVVVRDELGGGARIPLDFLGRFLDSAPAVEPEDATGPAFVLVNPGPATTGPRPR
jgi:hypothetical protein